MTKMTFSRWVRLQEFWLEREGEACVAAKASERAEVLMRATRWVAMSFSSSLLKMVHIDHAFGPLLTPKLDPGHRKITKVCHQYK